MHKPPLMNKVTNLRSLLWILSEKLVHTITVTKFEKAASIYTSREMVQTRIMTRLTH